MQRVSDEAGDDDNHDDDGVLNHPSPYRYSSRTTTLALAAAATAASRRNDTSAVATTALPGVPESSLVVGTGTGAAGKHKESSEIALVANTGQQQQQQQQQRQYLSCNHFRGTRATDAHLEQLRERVFSKKAAEAQDTVAPETVTEVDRGTGNISGSGGSDVGAGERKREEEGKGEEETEAENGDEKRQRWVPHARQSGGADSDGAGGVEIADAGNGVVPGSASRGDDGETNGTDDTSDGEKARLNEDPDASHTTTTTTITNSVSVETTGRDADAVDGESGDRFHKRSTTQEQGRRRSAAITEAAADIAKSAMAARTRRVQPAAARVRITTGLPEPPGSKARFPKPGADFSSLVVAAITTTARTDRNSKPGGGGSVGPGTSLEGRATGTFVESLVQRQKEYDIHDRYLRFYLQRRFESERLPLLFAARCRSRVHGYTVNNAFEMTKKQAVRMPPLV